MKTIDELILEHNGVVIHRYKVVSIPCFRNFILDSQTYSDGYIEIPSNETISGNPYILDLRA